VFEYFCKVTRVVDGDTIDVSVDLGFKGRATKDERTTIVTSSLEALNRVDAFLYQVDKKTR